MNKRTKSEISVTVSGDEGLEEEEVASEDEIEDEEREEEALPTYKIHGRRYTADAHHTQNLHTHTHNHETPDTGERGGSEFCATEKMMRFFNFIGTEFKERDAATCPVVNAGCFQAQAFDPRS